MPGLLGFAASGSGAERPAPARGCTKPAHSATFGQTAAGRRAAVGAGSLAAPAAATAAGPLAAGYCEPDSGSGVAVACFLKGHQRTDSVEQAARNRHRMASKPIVATETMCREIKLIMAKIIERRGVSGEENARVFVCVGDAELRDTMS